MNDGACLQRFLLLFQPMERLVGGKAFLSAFLLQSIPCRAFERHAWLKPRSHRDRRRLP
jgi:hypothetical protein